MEWSKHLNGWLSPTGEFFQCEQYRHVIHLEHELRCTSKEADKRGWLKIVDGEVLIIDRLPNGMQIIALNNAGFLCDTEAEYYGSPFPNDKWCLL
ncbi:MAG: hypothetical protein M0P73_01855 [Syntrophobacterales bacterium]|jgi:hypothetical protein|nr:hypothetical protein [Syntrophobacterales bacterium]